MSPADLMGALESANALRRLAAADPAARGAADLAETMLDRLLGVSRRLAVYGSLAPGRENHSVIEGIPGEWLEGFVRGRHHPSGWGATMGYPAMRWDPAGERIPVSVLVSEALPSHWARLDRFEGNEYERILVPVEDDSGRIAAANIYALR